MRSITITILGLATALPAQWDPINPGAFSVGGRDFGLMLGSNWYGHADPSGGIYLLHAGPHAVAYTDIAPFRLSMHVSYVWAVGPACAHGGRFIAADGWCGFWPRWYESDRDPMLGSPIDMWIGRYWQENLSMCLSGASSCPGNEGERSGFVLFVDDIRITPI